MRFEARKDKGVVIPLMGAMLIGLAAVIVSVFDVFSRPTNEETYIVLGSLGLFVLTLIFILDSLRRTYYELQEEALFIRFGLFKQTIRYEDITEFKESRSWLSSLAWTFDRVAIYKNGKLFVLVGPQDKALFLRELGRKINPPSIDF
jgi:UDP-N-acetylmuramyl pentapeptide phosphotransferase/UDP-N-acetylglucosamine-1-phosphate transferase